MQAHNFGQILIGAVVLTGAFYFGLHYSTDDGSRKTQSVADLSHLPDEDLTLRKPMLPQSPSGSSAEKQAGGAASGIAGPGEPAGEKSLREPQWGTSGPRSNAPALSQAPTRMPQVQPSAGDDRPREPDFAELMAQVRGGEATEGVSQGLATVPEFPSQGNSTFSDGSRPVWPNAAPNPPSRIAAESSQSFKPLLPPDADRAPVSVNGELGAVEQPAVSVLSDSNPNNRLATLGSGSGAEPGTGFREPPLRQPSGVASHSHSSIVTPDNAQLNLNNRQPRAAWNTGSSPSSSHARVNLIPINGPANQLRRPQSFQIHVVRSGETLEMIAEQYYRSREYYLEIYVANQDVLESPLKLPLGTSLKIPDLDERSAQSGG